MRILHHSNSHFNSDLLVLRYINMLHFFYRKDLSAPPSPKLQAENHSFSAVHDRLFDTFVTTLHIWRPSS